MQSQRQMRNAFWYPSEMTEVYERLAEARRNAGFQTASEAAERFGWKGSTYLGHENGSRGFRADKAHIYARAFGVSANWLLYGDTAQPTEIQNGLPTPADTSPATERGFFMRAIRQALRFLCVVTHFALT